MVIVLFFVAEDLDLVIFQLGKNLRRHLEKKFVIKSCNIFKMILQRYIFACNEYFGCLSTVLPQVLAADDGGGAAVEHLHTPHKGQEQGAPGHDSDPVTSMSHLYTVGARVESAWRYRLRKVVLRMRNYCNFFLADYVDLY